MFEELADRIESLAVPPGAEAVEALGALHSKLSARLSLALSALDASGDWALDGSVSLVAWARNHLGLTNQAAHRVVRAARCLRRLPVTADAWLAGSLSAGQVEVIVAQASDARLELLGQHEAALVPTLVPLDVAQTTRALRHWAAHADAILEGAEPAPEPAAEAQLVQTLDGRAYLRASFDAQGHEIISSALALADCGDRELSRSQRQGQAMVDVFAWFLDHQDDRSSKRNRPHLNVVIHHDALAAGEPGRSLSGNPLPGLVMRKIACDANIHRVITDGRSSILDYGRATRSIPPAVYTCLLLRDGGCRFPGCDRPGKWCEGHHVQHWEDGGSTELCNLVLLCSRHHHLVHLHDWDVKLRPDAALEVTWPDGTVRTSDPPLLC